MEQLGIAEGHIIKGKQLFIPVSKLGDLFGGCLAWYDGCQSLLCPAFGQDTQGRMTASC